ncbi:MAG: PD-(D/E)XK nuclease family protein [Deltaproteobacteria bacterium]|jgi:hypothetical protein|nr:PD-(D/E)XK nuclease family protein [Deltaproteobacteria bacterium]
MSKRHVESPTSLKLFLQCPALYKAQYVDRVYKSESNRYLERGIRVHELMERSVKGEAVDWSDEPGVKRNVAPILEALKRYADEGFEIIAETQAAVDKDGNAVDWWDDSAIYRSKIDLLMVDRERDIRVIMDWKTGKTPGEPLYQLGFNAMCLYPLFGAARFRVAFVYVDADRAEWFSVIGGWNNAWLTDESGKTMEELARSLAQVNSAYDSRNFPATPNDKCRWCGWKKCGLA